MFYVFVFQRKTNAPLQATTLHTLKKYFFHCISQNVDHTEKTLRINIAGLNEIRYVVRGLEL